MSPTFEKCPEEPSSQGPSLMVTQASNKFSRDLYKELRKENSKNLIVSPFSLSTALAMITPGAKGLTFSQVTFSYLKHSQRIFFQIKEALSLPSLEDTLSGYRFQKRELRSLLKSFFNLCSEVPLAATAIEQQVYPGHRQQNISEKGPPWTKKKVNNTFLNIEQARNLERCALKAAKLQHGKLKALHTWLISMRNAECGKIEVRLSLDSFLKIQLKYLPIPTFSNL